MLQLEIMAKFWQISFHCLRKLFLYCIYKVQRQIWSCVKRKHKKSSIAIPEWKKDTKNENNLKVIFVPIVPNFYCLLTKHFEKKEKISPLWATLAPQFLFLLLCFKIADVSVDTRQRSKSFLLPSVTFNPR